MSIDSNQLLNTSTSLSDTCFSSAGCESFATPDSKITDWSRPVTKCIAGDYTDLSLHNIIYNKKALTEDMWIELPAYAKQYLVSGLYQIDSSSKCNESISMYDVKHKNIWLRIPISVMDTSPGSKIYRLEMKHNRTLENMSLYFSYTIQDDEPCKPYVYM